MKAARKPALVVVVVVARPTPSVPYVERSRSSHLVRWAPPDDGLLALLIALDRFMRNTGIQLVSLSILCRANPGWKQVA